MTRDGWLKDAAGICGVEPTDKSVRKIQRRTGVNGKRRTRILRQLGWYRRAFGPFWDWRLFLYCGKPRLDGTNVLFRHTLRKVNELTW